MLDMEGIYRMVHNQTTIKRAIDYVREGRMRLLTGLTHLRQLCCDSWLCLEDYAGASRDSESVKCAASINPAQASGCWRAYGAAACQRTSAASLYPA